SPCSMHTSARRILISQLPILVPQHSAADPSNVALIELSTRIIASCVNREAMAVFRTAFALAFVASLALGSAARGEPQRFVFEKAEMGVPFRITLYAETE